MPNYTVVATMAPYFPPEIDPNSGARWYPSVLTVQARMLAASAPAKPASIGLSFRSSVLQDGTVLIVGGQVSACLLIAHASGAGAPVLTMLLLCRPLRVGSV